MGVLAKPEDVGVNVKFASPSFLIKKTDGDFRFVTAFNNLGQYARLLPTATKSCDEVLRKISSFKYLIQSDLTKSFFQIPLPKLNVSISVSDVLAGTTQMPFLNKTAWRSAQHECPDLRRAFSHLSQGAWPSRKSRFLKHFRHYPNVAAIDDQGLLVVYKQDPGVPRRS